MASVPLNPFWLQMIDAMKTPPPFYVTIDKHYHVMQTTGPMALTQVIKANNPPYKLLDTQKINPYTMCDVLYKYDSLEDKPNALLKPLQGSSWVGTTGEIYQWCYCNTNYIAIWVVTLSLLVLLILWILVYHLKDNQKILNLIKSYTMP